MVSRPRVYVETSVVSFLTSRRSGHPVTAARQHLTRRWWREERDRFATFVSLLVRAEVASGDGSAAEARLAAIASIPVLPGNPDITPLARRLVEESGLPPGADADAIHVASAATAGMHFLLTWNCRHIANATLRPRVVRICMEQGFRAPIMCTPEELFHV